MYASALLRLCTLLWASCYGGCVYASVCIPVTHSHPVVRFRGVFKGLCLMYVGPSSTLEDILRSILLS